MGGCFGISSEIAARLAVVGVLAVTVFAGCRSAPKVVHNEPATTATADVPRIPSPNPAAAEVPAGYRAEIVASGLTCPSSIEFDDEGILYVAEAGYALGDQSAPARVMRIQPDGRIELVADQLNPPVTDLLWYKGRLYISHRGKVSVLAGNRVVDIVTGLPSQGDFQNNQLSAGPDGKLYLGQGTASNSGVVGADNFAYGWLGRHPAVHDLSARPVELRETTFLSLNPFRFTRSSEKNTVETGPFQPFGKSGGTRVQATPKANGTILRFNPDGSEIEMYAWGLRNPFGVNWGPDGILYASEDSYDERGSRPIANAPDAIWQIKREAWYGFPDYAAGIPVTDPRFRPASGGAVDFILKWHPRQVEQPLVRLPPHSGVAKIDFSRSSQFGFEGQMFVAEVGDLQPITGRGKGHPGFQVCRVDPLTGDSATFFRTRPDALGTPGMEYVNTAGPKRPVDVRFSREGDALYVADLGSMMVGTGATPMAHPFASSGVIWRISRDEMRLKFPIGISFIPGKANDAMGGAGAVVSADEGSGKK